MAAPGCAASLCTGACEWLAAQLTYRAPTILPPHIPTPIPTHLCPRPPTLHAHPRMRTLTHACAGDKPWISEMYGYSFGCAKAGVWHTTRSEFMLYPGYMARGVSGWAARCARCARWVVHALRSCGVLVGILLCACSTAAAAAAAADASAAAWPSPSLAPWLGMARCVAAAAPPLA